MGQPVRGTGRPVSNPGRRALLRGALAGCAALAATGRARRTLAAAAPARGSAPLRLVAAISYAGGVYGGAAQEEVEGYLAAHFAGGRQGLRVTTMPAPDPDRSSLEYQGAVAAAVAGSGPDVLAGTGYQLPAFADAGALVPLAPWVRRARVDLAGFSPGHLASLTRPPHGLVALPAFDSPDVLLMNRGQLAESGVSVPSPDWTYTEAADVWTRATTDRAGVHLYGTTIDVEEYVTALFGGQVMDASGTRCLLDDPRVLAAADWLVPLVRRGIAYPSADPTLADREVRQGRAAFGMSPASSVRAATRDMNALGVPWDWMPMPFFPPFPPGHRLTYSGGDWYGMNAHSSNPPEVVWELLSFFVLDVGYQQLMYHLTWVPPNRVDLWPAWMALVRRLDPSLRDKRLESYQGAMAYAMPDVWFRFDPYTADSLIKLALVAIASGRVSAASGLALLTRSINSLERQGMDAPPAK